jgi:hypothetical protein
VPDGRTSEMTRVTAALVALAAGPLVVAAQAPSGYQQVTTDTVCSSNAELNVRSAGHCGQHRMHPLGGAPALGRNSWRRTHSVRSPRYRLGTCILVACTALSGAAGLAFLLYREDAAGPQAAALGKG